MKAGIQLCDLLPILTYILKTLLDILIYLIIILIVSLDVQIKYPIFTHLYITHYHCFFLGFLNGNFFSITYKFWSLIKKISKKCWLPHIFFNATVILFYFILFFLNLINNQNIIPFIIADFPGKKKFSSARKHTYPPTSAPPTLWGLGRPSFFQRPRFPTDFARFYIIINVLLLSQIILQ